MYAPVSMIVVAWIAVMAPSFLTPTFTVVTVAWRVRPATISSSRVSSIFTGRRARWARTAARTARRVSSLPP